MLNMISVAGTNSKASTVSKGSIFGVILTRIRTRINSNTNTFHAGYVANFQKYLSDEKHKKLYTTGNGILPFLISVPLSNLIVISL